MIKLGDTDGTGLVWTRSGFRGDWELKWGSQLVAHLLTVPEKKGLGEAEAAEGSWVFFERGLVRRRTVIATRQGMEVGSFASDGLAGTVTLSDGRALRWGAHDEWRREWGLVSGNELLFKMVRHSRVAGSAHVPTDARVDVNPAHLADASLPMLLLFAGYLLATRPAVEKFAGKQVVVDYDE